MEGEKMKKKDFYLVESDSDIGKKKKEKKFSTLFL